jgi:hypothetical protein
MRFVNHVQYAESPMLSSDVVVVYVQVTRIKLAPTCSLTLSAQENIARESTIYELRGANDRWDLNKITYRYMNATQSAVRGCLFE